MNEEQEVFEQDLSHSEQAGAVFIIKLLFRNHVELPEKEKMMKVMKKHLGKIDCFAHDNVCAGIAATKYVSHFKDADVPPQLMITSCIEFKGDEIDDFQRSQFWDCENSEEILSECKYQVIATDMSAAGLKNTERAELDMDCAEALVELYPECEAIFFFNSGKMFAADDLRNHNIPREDRFIKFAVNVRFFNVQNTEDMIIDTLGMSTLFLPDLQYHFTGMDPNIIVNHAYCTASYILNNDSPIENGDTIDAAMPNGAFNRNIQWKCNYEDSLIQPSRPVIDVLMNEYAAGNRNYENRE